MDWSKYSALKSDSKASMAKEEKKAAVLYEEGDSELRVAKAAVKYKKDDSIPEGKKVGDVKEAAVKAVKVGDEKEAAQEAVYLSQKRWNPESGEAQDDSKEEWALDSMEAEKARYDADMAKAKAQSDGLKAAIADHKKL